MKIKQILFTIMVCGVGLVSNSYAQSYGYCQLACVNADDLDKTLVMRTINAKNCSDSDVAKFIAPCAKALRSTLPALELQGWPDKDLVKNFGLIYTHNGCTESDAYSCDKEFQLVDISSLKAVPGSQNVVTVHDALNSFSTGSIY